MIMASEMAHSSAGLGFDSHRAIRLAARIPAVISSAPLRISFTGALYHLRFLFATQISQTPEDIFPPARRRFPLKQKGVRAHELPSGHERPVPFNSVAYYGLTPTDFAVEPARWPERARPQAW